MQCYRLVAGALGAQFGERVCQGKWPVTAGDGESGEADRRDSSARSGSFTCHCHGFWMNPAGICRIRFAWLAGVGGSQRMSIWLSVEERAVFAQN
jgi:hypothetical protein